ncbi:MAG: hypothetical protein AMJ68_02070 [Acidithiobacillales bacterium SG8_45]|jgi:hypothetical protein|nr:MAG: hypothetical protein AMJ68_02070 [Acidithiobacillales bacterium SG8_45]
MTPVQFILVVIAALAFFYWLDALRAKELAHQAGKTRCLQDGVTFLDDSVVLRQTALRRGPRGRISLYRNYLFEFSSDGSTRYRGEIELLNKQVVSVTLEPFRITDYH